MTTIIPDEEDFAEVDEWGTSRRPNDTSKRKI